MKDGAEKDTGEWQDELRTQELIRAVNKVRTQGAGHGWDNALIEILIEAVCDKWIEQG